MAQEDVLIYENYVEHAKKTMQEAVQVFPILFGNEELMNFVKFASKYELSDINTLAAKMGRKQSELEAYMHCAHVNSKTHDLGHDSHKDYFQKTCTNCGKVLEEWSV